MNDDDDAALFEKERIRIQTREGRYPRETDGESQDSKFKENTKIFMHNQHFHVYYL